MIKTREFELLGVKHTEVYATDGYVCKKGETPSEVRHRPLLEGQSVEDFYEVMELPAYSEDEYKAKVSELIRLKYSNDKEFGIQREMTNAMRVPPVLSEEAAENAIREYEAYNAYVEQCRVDARAILSTKN